MFRSQPTTGCMGAAAARAKWRSRTARSLLRARPRARSLSARDDKQERARLLASAGIDRRAQLGCDDRLLPGADLIDGVLHRGPPQPLRHTEFLRGVLTHQLVPDLTLRQVRGSWPPRTGPTQRAARDPIPPPSSPVWTPCQHKHPPAPLTGAPPSCPQRIRAHRQLAITCPSAAIR